MYILQILRQLQKYPIQRVKLTNSACISIETDFTLTDSCRAVIINSWHYSKRVGVKLWKQQT